MSRALPVGEIPGLRGEFALSDVNEFRSRDGRRHLAIELRPQGVRDLHAAVLRMARTIDANPRISWGCVALWKPRLSRERLEREWKAIQSLFKPSLAARLAVLALGGDTPWVAPERSQMHRTARILQDHLTKIERPEEAAPHAPSRKSFEVLKVLLNRWLLRKGPVSVGGLMRICGSSYPTVSEALDRLAGRNEIVRRSNRSVELAAFPGETWGELLAFSASMRRPLRFADFSGRPPNLPALLGRLRAGLPKNVAIGGVVAAKYWNPAFDLHGLPRLDLCVHSESGRYAYSNFMEKIDPAVRPVSGKSGTTALAVHPVFRADPLFEVPQAGSVRWADPVETLLDLHELRLIPQAERMIARLSQRKTR